MIDVAWNAMTDSLKLSELAAVKICHDLAGPIGAINNGIELLKEPDGDLHQESLELVEMSAKEAVSKLLYLRQALGSGSPQGESNINNLMEIADNYFTNSKITLRWNLPQTSNGTVATVPSPVAKQILNMILLVSGSLIMGGDMLVNVVQNGKNTSVKIRGESSVVKLADDVLFMLDGNTNNEDINVKNMLPYLIYLTGKENNSPVTIEHSQTHVEVCYN